MYPEGDAGAGAAPAADYFPVKSRFAANIEGLIPLILIILIAFVAAVWTGIITSNTPVIGPVVALVKGTEQPVSLLIIGQPSTDLRIILDEDKDLVSYRIKDVQDLERSAEEQLAQYDVVMLDQHLQANKEVSRQLGEAIQDYVKRGGKFITVLDSGIRRKDSADVLGWEATFGNIVPVTCEKQAGGEPSCLDRRTVRGKIFRQDVDHRIMKGIEEVPADPSLGLIMLEVLNVPTSGNEIAYAQDMRTPQYYTAIVEEHLIIGKSIYFNYDPGRTRGIFEATIRYLTGRS